MGLVEPDWLGRLPDVSAWPESLDEPPDFSVLVDDEVAGCDGTIGAIPWPELVAWAATGTLPEPELPPAWAVDVVAAVALVPLPDPLGLDWAVCVEWVSDVGAAGGLLDFAGPGGGLLAAAGPPAGAGWFPGAGAGEGLPVGAGAGAGGLAGPLADGLLGGGGGGAG